MNKKIILCSGGTGGHVIPAINFGNYLLQKGYDCSIILDSRGKRYSNKFKGKVYIINSSHFSGNFFFKIRFFFNFLNSFIKSSILIFRIKPSKCISFGSYAAFTPLLISLILKPFIKIKIYIHEQNSVIGKVNLFYLPYAERIFTNFNSLTNLNNKFLSKKIYVGTPINELINIKNTNLIKSYDKDILFVYGGSQGSVPLINKFLSIIKKIDSNYLKNIKLIIQCPKILISTIENTLKEMKIDFLIKDFYNNIDEILLNTNIAIVRAGAGTINDLIKYQIPAIIMPLPHSIYNHQYHNAKYLTDKNCAILFNEKDFNININSKILNKLIINKKEQIIIKNNLQKIILPDANKKMLKNIF